MVAQKASECLDVAPRTVRRLLATVQRPKRASDGSKMAKQKWRKRKQNAKTLPIRCTESHLQLDKRSSPVEICSRLHDIGKYRQLGLKVSVLMLQGLNFNSTCVSKLLWTLNLGELPGLASASWHELHRKFVSLETGVVFCFVDSITYKNAPELYSDLGGKRRHLEEGWKTSNDPPQWRRRRTLHALQKCSPVSTPVSALWGMPTWHPKLLA